MQGSAAIYIYNSRNYSILLNISFNRSNIRIYNSRNYSILLNKKVHGFVSISTTVEIILYYLTVGTIIKKSESTTVEIILYYLTL